MRDYNFRKFNKTKEQLRRKEVYHNRGYFPTCPKEVIGNKGELNYVEGSKDNWKQELKRISNKAVRNSSLEETKDGRHYKKIYNLQWEWY